MAKEKLPQLTEAQIRKLASGPSFERGRDYYQEGDILEPVRQERELRAQCAGSAYEPYQVSATLAEEGIKSTSCSCPYDQGGICKHRVALLLTYVHKPEAFRVIAPLEALLAKCSQKELISLIGEMIKREPELHSVVELSTATKQAGAGKPLDVAAYRRQARRALQHESLHVIEKELRALKDSAARFGKAGDWLNAGAVYHTLLDTAVGGYDDVVHQMDEEGYLAILIDELAQGLAQSLQKSKADGKTRRKWLDALLDAELTDIEIGGIDLAPSASEAILEQATDDEWRYIEKRVKSILPGSRDFARQMLVGFIAAGHEQRGRTEEATALIREMGTPEQKIYLLVQEGEIEKAVQRMRKILGNSPGLATQFADALVKVGAKDAAVELVTERARGDDTWCTDWLAKYYRKHGNPQEAAAWQQKVFLEHPSVQAFEALREVSSKTGGWEEARAKVLRILEKKKAIGSLIEISLHEGDVERALELLPQVEKHGWRDFRLEVARAAEKKHPEASIGLYQVLAERTIGARQRVAYKEAAQHLKRVKSLFERLSAQSVWEDYLQALRSQYARLPALQEEMRKARLW